MRNSTGLLRRSLLSCLVIAGMATAAQADEGTKTASVAAPEKVDSSQAFLQIEKAFIQNYSALANYNQEHNRPMILVSGFNYSLLLADGTTESINSSDALADNLKAIAHVGPYIYAISRSHWNDPTDTSWKDKLRDCQTNIQGALAVVDQTSWKNDAWPGGEEKLKAFLHQSLATALDFTTQALKKGDISKADYESFANKFLPTMTSSFYLATLSGTYDTLKTLNAWKTKVGQEGWDRMYVVIAGSKGRTTAGLTKETNTAAVTVASLMKPHLAKTHIVMAPSASTSKEALTDWGLVLTASGLADATFTTPEAKKAAGFYDALKTSDIPLALRDIQDIIRGLKDGTAKDPVLGLGPKVAPVN